VETIASPQLGFIREANRLESTDNLTKSTKRQNAYKCKLMRHQNGP